MEITDKQRAVLKRAFEAVGKGAFYGQDLLRRRAPYARVKEHLEEMTKLLASVNEACDVAEGANEVLSQIHEVRDREETSKVRLRSDARTRPGIAKVRR